MCGRCRFVVAACSYLYDSKLAFARVVTPQGGQRGPYNGDMRTVYTIGHSTRPIEEFIGLLRDQGVTRLIDIRTVPKSRHNPQYWHDALEKSLAAAGLGYEYVQELGGLRPAVKESVNTGWRNKSFRNYADYMQTDEFAHGLDVLLQHSEQETVAIMCAEAVPWRCHRSLVGDALVVRGVTVKDIISQNSVREHTLTSFAVVEGMTITYPSDEATA